MLSSEITDKFDYTFLFGDLNFRLEVSRLHADWLIARQGTSITPPHAPMLTFSLEYAQALSFDQLYNLMRNGQAFVGFREAPINFPPTFKYDVLRTLKAKRRNSRASAHPTTPGRPASTPVPTPTPTPIPTPRDKPPEEAYDEDEDEPEDVDGEAASSMSASTRRDADSNSTTSSSSSSARRRGARALVKRISVRAARSARVKWHELVSPGTSPVPGRVAGAGRSAVSVGVDGEERVGTPIGLGIGMGKRATGSLGDVSLGASPMMVRASSTKSGVWSTSMSVSGQVSEDGGEEGEERDKGVYDSSSKQRVPSWSGFPCFNFTHFIHTPGRCDRILFKSTVKPGPDPEDTEHPLTLNKSIFGHIFRTISRRGSVVSPTSPSTTDSTIHPYPQSPPATTFPPFAVPSASPRRPRPRSTEVTSLVLSQRQVKRSFSSLALSQAQSPTSSSASPSTSPPNSAPLTAFAYTPPPASADLSPSASPPARPQIAYAHQRASSVPSPPPRDRSGWRIPWLNAREQPPAKISGGPLVGEVECLAYSALDDRGMRRLEGRSDHRPVIGSYALYI